MDDVLHVAGDGHRRREGRPVLHHRHEQGREPLGRAGPAPRDGDPQGAHVHAVVHGARHEAGAGEGEGRDVRPAVQGVLDRHRRSDDPPADVRGRVHRGGRRRRDRRAGFPLRRPDGRRHRPAVHRLLRRHPPRRPAVQEERKGLRRGGADPERAGEPDRLPAGAAQAGDREDHPDDAAEVGAAPQRRRAGRQRRDQAGRQGRSLGRRRPGHRFLGGEDAGQGLHAEGGHRHQPPLRHRRRRAAQAEVRRAGVLLPNAQRDRDRDAVRGRQAVDAPRRSPAGAAQPGRQGSPLHARLRVHVQAGRQRRLVRRRRPRQVRRQRRHQRLDADEPVRARGGARDGWPTSPTAS